LVAAYATTIIPRYDMYPLQLSDGRYVSVTKRMGLNLVAAHLKGAVTIGAYALDEESRAKWVCFDADDEDGWMGLRGMAGDLKTIADMVMPGADLPGFPWPPLCFQHTNAIRAQLAERYAPATANRMLSALRQTLKRCWRLGQMTAEEYHRAADVGNVKGSTLPAGRDVSSGEIAALITTCENDPGPAGPRDAAIIALMAAGGLRRAEVVALDLGDYDPETGKLILRGKRRKERTVYATNGTERAIRDWLALRGDQDGALFCPVSKGGRITPRRMTAQAVYNMLGKRGEEAGVVGFSPHDLRRAFVGDLLDAGVDIGVIARMAGHANVQTTARYDRRPERAKQEAASRLHIPYRGRRASSVV
jgi:integrase